MGDQALQLTQYRMNTQSNPLRLALISPLILILLSMLSAPVLAQIDAGALQQGLEQQLPMPSPLALPEPGKPIGPKNANRKEGDIQFTVNSFVLEGVKVIPQEQVQAVLKPWVGKPVDFDDLQNACNAIMDFYRSKGFTVQAILPPQKIAGGVVKILITEATLSSVIIESPQGDTRFGKDRAAKYIAYSNPIGEPLNLDNLERALIILNETPGVMISSQLEAGEKPGETAVRAQLTQPDFVQGRVEVNNNGSRTTGANQGVVSLALNNITGIGDQATINAIGSQGSQYVQGSYSAPVSPNGLRVGISGTYLEYKNVSNYAYPNGGNGQSGTVGVSAAYPLMRSSQTNANITANYDNKNYLNTNTSSDATISSYKINDFTLGLSGNHYDSFGGSGLSTGAVSIIFGQLGINSSSVPGYGQYTPSSYQKLAFNGSRTQTLTADGVNTLYVAISGQLANANLNSAEQFYLGGPYGVRAYPVAQSPGAQGGLFTAEYRRLLPQNLTLSTFFDAGMVQQYKNLYPGWQGLTNANNTYSLMGAGLGLKWAYNNWNVSGTVAWKVGANPLYNQSGQAVNTDGSTTQPRGWINASYSF